MARFVVSKPLAFLSFSGVVERSLKVTALLLIVGIVAACSGGSGSSNTPNPGSGTGGGNQSGDFSVVYNGPAPRDDDVNFFRNTLWKEIARTDRCGACHTLTGGQSPTFARSDNINSAYDTIASLVQLSSPASSRIVTKVASEGHNCWLGTLPGDIAACGNFLTGWIQDWANGPNSSGSEINLTPPAIKEIGQSKTFPGDRGNFDTTVYPLLAQPGGFCYQCHSEDAATSQQPYFGSSDIDVAYEAVKTKIDLQTTRNSRLVVRLRDESHNCWSDCASNSATMQSAVDAFVNNIPLTTVDPTLLTSKALNLSQDGISASAGGRIENGVIALWTFDTGTGVTAFDKSGVDPAINLNIIGDVEWLGSWGVQINGGKLQGTTDASKKLFDRLGASGSYSIEAWVVPENVVQDNIARIISYSGGSNVRNFTLGQSTYNYDFLNRSTVTNGDGMPALSTPDDDEVLQATLQHVVATYSAVDGRRIYVNGELVSVTDPEGAGSFEDWNDNYALVLGNELTNNNPWKGSIRLLAIHDRALSVEDIQTNYDVGVGQKFYLLFNVSDIISIPLSYVVVEVAQFDNHSYLFNQPFFVSLDPNANISSIPVRGMRIGVNGQEVGVGQIYENLDTTITAAQYTAEGNRQTLSTLGSVIPLDLGPENDEFFLTFDLLGTETYVRTGPVVPSPGTPVDLPDQSDIGVKTFAEINATLSQMTGVDMGNASVKATYENVKQQLPVSEAIGGFLPSHQMAVTQLAVSYCNQLVANPGSYFGSFNFGAAPTNSGAFNAAGRTALITPLLDNLLTNDLADGANPASELLDQPDPAVVTSELNGLIDSMLATCANNSCAQQNSPSRVYEVALGTCAAAYGSAIMLVQ